MASTSKTKKTKGSSPRFVEILWSMVNNEDEIKKCGKYISWNESGTGIVIESRNELASHVLPTYFNTREFSSFHRQLTNYGFKKLQDVEGDEFVNENFIRGFPELRKNIIKKKPPDKHKKGSSARGESLKTHHPSQNSSTCTSLPHNPQVPAASEQLTAKRPQEQMTSLENELSNQKLKKLRASDVLSTDPDSSTLLRSLGTASAVEGVLDQAYYSLQIEGELQELLFRNTEEIGHANPDSKEDRNDTVSHSFLEELVDNVPMGYPTPQVNDLRNMYNATSTMQLNTDTVNTSMGGDFSKHDEFVPVPVPSDINSRSTLLLLDLSQQSPGVSAQFQTLTFDDLREIDGSEPVATLSRLTASSSSSSFDSCPPTSSIGVNAYKLQEEYQSQRDDIIQMPEPPQEKQAQVSRDRSGNKSDSTSSGIGLDDSNSGLLSRDTSDSESSSNMDQMIPKAARVSMFPAEVDLSVPHGNSSDSGLGSHSCISGPQSRDLSENENNAVVHNAIIEICPDVVGLSGAPFCEFLELAELFPEVQSGYYTIEGVEEEFLWEKGDKHGKGDRIPSSPEEGEKTVIIWSLSREKMGEATLLYVDRRKHKREKRFKTDVKKLTQQLADIAISLRDRADQSEIGETQYSEICESARKVQVLRLSAHIATMMHDLKNAAIYLKKITDRFARHIAPEGTESFDWSELFEVFDAPHEQNEASDASEDESRQLEGSEGNDSSYYGDVESSSCDSAAEPTSHSEDDLSEMFSKETQETRSRLNESAVSRKENLNKDQMPDKTDTTSKNYMLPFGNKGNFSRKEIVITRREMPSKHILDKHCNFQVNVHVYREMINFPKVTSCRQPLISALLTIKAESVKRYLSTIHERWRIQLQPKQFSRITYTSSRSVLCQKVHLDPDKDTLSFSLTKPASKEKNTVVKDLFPPILRYFEVGQSLSNDEGSAVQWEAFRKRRSKASDVWVLTSTYRPKEKTLFVCVGDRQDFFPLEWFEDEDCELSTNCWKWCGYSDRLGERVMEVQEQSEITFRRSSNDDLPYPLEVFTDHVEFKESITASSRGLMLPSTCRVQLGQSIGTNKINSQCSSSGPKWPIGHSQQNASLGVDDVTCASSADEIEREISNAKESVSFQCTTIPQQEAGRIARDPIVRGIAKGGKLGDAAKFSEEHFVLCLFKRRIIARDKLEHRLYAIPGNKYQEIFPKIARDEALVHHGTEFPMGEEHKTTLKYSLHRHLRIADVLLVKCKMVLGHSFAVEEPCMRKVTVSEIHSKSNQPVTAGFSVPIVINCHGSRDKLYEDKVRVIIQSGSTTLRLIFPVSHYEESISPSLLDSSVTSMPHEDRIALRRCYVALLDNIGDVMVLCDQLHQHNIFDDDDLDEVMSLTKRRDRNAYVLRAIQTRGNVLDFFIKVMQAKRENQGAAAILQEMRHQVYSGAIK